LEISRRVEAETIQNRNREGGIGWIDERVCCITFSLSLSIESTHMLSFFIQPLSLFLFNSVTHLSPIYTTFTFTFTFCFIIIIIIILLK
jgi:hypothetical protein